MSAWFESIFGLILLDPGLLILSLLIPAGLVIRRRRGLPAMPFAPALFLEPPLPRSWRVRLLWVPVALQVLALLLVVTALARPVRKVPLPPLAEGIDIMLCLDISSSMTSLDLDPRRTRLDLTREAANRFISGRPRDRIGLVCFARFPDLRCPPTLDHQALKQILTKVTTVESDNPEDATGIGTAVAGAARILSDSDSESRVIILLTDGEENVAMIGSTDEIAPLHSAQLCEHLGLRLYTIAAGIGRPDRTGGWIPLDTSLLEEMADHTGGRFFEARDADAITGVYAAIDTLERSAHEEPRFRLVDQFVQFLLAALGLWLLSRLLRSIGLEVQP